MDSLYWPQPGWVQFQLWYLEVPGLLVTTLQFCLVQCYKEIQHLLQNKMSTCDMCSAWSCTNSRDSGFAVTNENKINPKRTNILRIYLLNCCFGLNKNDEIDNYESTISGEPYMWRNQDYHWDVTLDFNLCGTAPWTDIHHQFILDSPCPSVCLSVCPSVCRRHGFRSVTQVYFGISIWNFICMLLVAMGRSLLIFSNVTFKMAAWQPSWIFRFPDSNFCLALNIKSKLQ